jgi:hypothetical protein
MLRLPIAVLRTRHEKVDAAQKMAVNFAARALRRTSPGFDQDQAWKAKCWAKYCS